MNRPGRAGRYGSRVTEAKDKTKAPAAAAPAEPEAPAPETLDGDPEVETDPRKRFKAALDRKNASPGTHPGSMASGSNDLKSSNGKRQRQFRRKSGG
jgi:hypothetical protein